MGFDLGGMLEQYLGGGHTGSAEQVGNDFHQVAQAAPAEAVGSGIAAALRSDQTPPFAQMVGQLFGNGDPQQRVGMLNQLVSGMNPAMLASLGGGLGGLFSGGAGQAATVNPDAAAQMAPAQVEQLAAHAEQNDPGIIDKMGSFYAQHPTLVKTIGGVALSIAMGKIAQNMQS